MFEYYFLIAGLILFIYAGFQDFKTHKPIALIPALILMGLAVNLLTGFVIGMLAFLSLYGLPDKINKVFGKADIFLITGLAALMFMARSQVFIQMILFATIITIPLIFIYMKKNPEKMLPYVGLFTIGFFVSLFIDLIITILVVV